MNKILLFFIVYFLPNYAICQNKTSVNWQHLDYTKDKVLGISLNKWNIENNQVSKRKDIIVAVLDTQIDLNHESIKESIWFNKKEIPNNGKDDDNNGYIDDVNGWNFLGTKSGKYLLWANFEFVRIVKKYDSIFKNLRREEVQPDKLKLYDEYVRALKFKNNSTKYFTTLSKTTKYHISVYNKAKDTLKYFFPKQNYTFNQLDSLYRKYKINNKTLVERSETNDQDLAALMDSFMTCLESNLKNKEDIIDLSEQYDSILNKNLNVNNNERLDIDNSKMTLEKGYGCNVLNFDLKGVKKNNKHNTEVSSLITGSSKNDDKVKGFSNKIKIMPLSISPSGDEHDKDIAMAIHYAVDNGAKVINMSFAKEFTLYPELVIEAMRYAERNNVLLVHASGNDGFNSDENPIYPNDYYYDNKSEVCNNFISVGSINKNYNERIVSSFSNYGKQNVDIFAPGEDIYVAIPDNKYKYDSGTSLACPMVSGTAALIWLYYPKLTVQQVKKIILESGISFDQEVIVPGTKDKKVKFAELSKSGKILNVYNAMKMAEKMSKKK